MKKILYFLLCMLLILPLAAQNNEFDMDSALYVYYQKCEKIAKTPQILAASDTLFRMAGRVGDKRTQAAALCHKANYFYYTRGSQDSLRKYVKEVQHFAKATAQPKYYYWIWQRYVENYIYKRKLNLALLELEAMQKEATEDDYKPGIIACYKLMAMIYNYKFNDLLAVEYQKKALELTEQYDKDNFNLSTMYANMATILLNLEQADEAYPYIQKAYETAKSEAQKVMAGFSEVLYSQLKGDKEKMLKLIHEIEAMNMPNFIDRIRDARYNYYREIEDYEKADEMLDSMYKSQYMDRQRYLRKKVRTLKMIPGKERKTIMIYEEYENLADSLNKADAQISLEEFATIMDVTRLNAENAKLELAVSRQKLHIIYIVLAGIGILLVVMGVFTLKVVRLNRNLRLSQEDLQKKNQALIEADKIIKKEKEHAESASRMKTVFIQNMSHEIRTPLNSIVGFSQVLAGELEGTGQEDMKMYAQVITENSNNLLKLVSDVIELSSLDAIDKEEPKSPVSINELCVLAMEQVKNKLAPEVTFNYHAWTNEYLILSNGKLILLVLENLLHNAAKFTITGNITLECSLSVDTQQMKISVTDTGIGIPMDKQEWVFERFAKVDDFSQGAGLGLSISRLAARHLGGNVIVDSAYKEGCKMLFVFPVEEYQISQ